MLRRSDIRPGLAHKLLAVALLTSTLSVTSWAAPLEQAAKPKVSAPFLLAGGAGSQQFPYLGGDIVVYDDCPEALGLCKVKALDLKTHLTSTIAVTEDGGLPHTDGVRAVWTDARNKTGRGIYELTDNLDVYAANLSDYTVFPVVTAPKMQNTAGISGNVIVWTDYRNVKGRDDYDAADIYMYDIASGKESLITNTPGPQTAPVTNGKIVVWDSSSASGSSSGKNGIYGYDLATKKEFRISAGDGYSPAISGNIVVWESPGETKTGIHGYDLTTKKEFVVSAGSPSPGGQHSPSISGNIVVWEDWRTNRCYEGGLCASDVYGYDLATKQEFPIVVGAALHTRPSVSGNTVVWEDNPLDNIGGSAEVKGATISGIATSPVPTRPQPPTSRLFSETGMTVSGMFLDYWNKNGGLPQQGYPISSIMTEVSDLDGKPYRVQYFERAVFEEHPEKEPPYNVLLSQLGTFRFRDKHPDEAKAPTGSGPGAISGHVYNGEVAAYVLPPSQVYAISVNGGKHYSVASWYAQDTFTLNGVEPGSYYLVAYFDEQSVSGYTKAALCLRANPNAICDDHSLITVTVKPNETTQGIEITDEKGPFPAQPPDEERCRMFKETGKKLCGPFLKYWLTHGDLPQQGYPISNQTTEVSDLDGKQYAVQYFERAVFELHPENKPPYDVLLSQLGTFRYKQKYGGK